MPRDGVLGHAYSRSGSPGQVGAVVSEASCDDVPVALSAAVAEGAAGGTVGVRLVSGMFPPGAACRYSLKLTGSASNTDGSVPTDTRSFGFVVDSSLVERAIVLAAKYNHSPVVYVRQDDGRFTLHVPKQDFTWFPGGCLIQRAPTSAQLRAAICRKVGDAVDLGWHVLALSAADWTLSADSAQIAKLGTVPPPTDSAYWADTTPMVANPTPDLWASTPAKAGNFTLDDFGVVSFRPNVGPVTQVAANNGAVKLVIGW